MKFLSLELIGKRLSPNELQLGHIERYSEATYIGGNYTPPQAQPWIILTDFPEYVKIRLDDGSYAFFQKENVNSSNVWEHATYKPCNEQPALEVTDCEMSGFDLIADSKKELPAEVSLGGSVWGREEISKQGKSYIGFYC